ncbi:hypothetical protein ACOME3_004601 [Neoechinorhynchus agilis]
MKRSDDVEQVPLPAKIRNLHPANAHVTVILEKAALEIIKTAKQRYCLLNCDQHVSELKKHNRKITQCRPDIAHQSLMMLLDSPLNRAGRLRLFIRTDRNVSIRIDPQCRIPRTFMRFSALSSKTKRGGICHGSFLGLKL